MRIRILSDLHVDSEMWSYHQSRRMLRYWQVTSVRANLRSHGSAKTSLNNRLFTCLATTSFMAGAHQNSLMIFAGYAQARIFMSWRTIVFILTGSGFWAVLYGRISFCLVILRWQGERRANHERLPPHPGQPRIPAAQRHGYSEIPCSFTAMASRST